MDGLTAFSLAAPDPFWTDDNDPSDWLRTEAAAAAIALSESPQDAIAVALHVASSTVRTAIRIAAVCRIALNNAIRLFLSDIVGDLWPSVL
jgi:hypothetical protein